MPTSFWGCWAAASACSGKVDTGFSIRTCAPRQEKQSVFRSIRSEYALAGRDRHLTQFPPALSLKASSILSVPAPAPADVAAPPTGHSLVLANCGRRAAAWRDGRRSIADKQ